MLAGVGRRISSHKKNKGQVVNLQACVHRNMIWFKIMNKFHDTIKAILREKRDYLFPNLGPYNPGPVMLI
jgi:hypothetical protein